MWRMGLRRGELLGLRGSDIHFLPSSSALGCGFAGTHLHVVRRDNPNQTSAKSRRSRVVPADWLTVQTYDQYVAERAFLDPDHRSDFVVVNLLTTPVGVPMRPGGLNELLHRLSERAELPRQIRPHMLRHSLATSVAAAGWHRRRTTRTSDPGQHAHPPEHPWRRGHRAPDRFDAAAPAPTGQLCIAKTTPLPAVAGHGPNRRACRSGHHE